MVLLNWAPIFLGRSGLRGYLLEYQLRGHPDWINTQTGAPTGLESTSMAGRLPASVLVATAPVALANLPNGSLTFRVTAVNNAGLASETYAPSKVQYQSLGTTQRTDAADLANPKAARTNSLAESFLHSGLDELAARDYVGASRDLDIALGMDSGVGHGAWRRRAARLRELVLAADLDMNDRQELAAPSEAGDLESRAVSALLAAEPEDAMILAHVAAGSGGSDSAYSRLLIALSRITRQGVVREDVVASAAFVGDRSRRAIEATRARRYETALRAAHEALLIAPEDPEAWVRFGSINYASGRRDEALKAYRKALKLQPDNKRLSAFVKEKFGE